MLGYLGLLLACLLVIAFVPALTLWLPQDARLSVTDCPLSRSSRERVGVRVAGIRHDPHPALRATFSRKSGRRGHPSRAAIARRRIADSVVVGVIASGST